MTRYIYQYDQWPHFKWDEDEIYPILGEVRHLTRENIGANKHFRIYH